MKNGVSLLNHYISTLYSYNIETNNADKKIK